MSIADVISVVAGPLPGNVGGAEFGGIAVYLFGSLLLLANAVAILTIVIAGFSLVSRQSDEQVQQTRRTIQYSVSALVLINVIPRIAEAFLHFGSSGPSILTVEILGFIRFIEVPLAAIAILMIIVSGIRAILHFGDEQGVTQLRRTVLSILAGFLLILTKFYITQSAVGGSPGPIMQVGVILLNMVLGFLALIATVVVIYAGFLMIVNLGNDEQYTKAKTLLLRVGIGFIVLFASIAIVNLVLGLPMESGI